MQLAQWLLLLAVLAWITGLAAATGAALREFVRPPLSGQPAPIRGGALALVAHYADRRLPASWRAEQMSRLLRAGAERRWSPPDWFALRCGGAAAGGCLGLLMALRWPPAVMLAPVPAALLGWWLPDAWLRLQTRIRRRRIRTQLMLHLELLLAGLESGLSLREALRLAVEYGPPGPLAAALAGTLRDSPASCEADELLRRFRRRLQSPAADAALRPLLRAAGGGAAFARALQAVIARHAHSRLEQATSRARRSPRRALGSVATGFAPAVLVAVAIPAALHWLERP